MTKSLSKFNSKHCTEIFKQMAAGCTDTEAMAKLGISRGTFYRWKKEHPEFAEAHDRGIVQYEASMDRLGRAGMLKEEDIDFQFWKELNRMNHSRAEKISQGTTNNTQINIFNDKTDEELIGYIKSQLEQHPEIGRIIDVDGTA